MSKQRNSQQIARDAGGGRVAWVAPKSVYLVVNGKRGSAPRGMGVFVRRGDVLGVRLKKPVSWGARVRAMSLELGKQSEMVTVEVRW